MICLVRNAFLFFVLHTIYFEVYWYQAPTPLASWIVRRCSRHRRRIQGELPAAVVLLYMHYIHIDCCWFFCVGEPRGFGEVDARAWRAAEVSWSLPSSTSSRFIGELIGTACIILLSPVTFGPHILIDRRYNNRKTTHALKSSNAIIVTVYFYIKRFIVRREPWFHDLRFYVMRHTTKATCYSGVRVTAVLYC